MLEKRLSDDFANIFKEFSIWTPNNRTAGWPDRGIQNKLEIIWFELKIIPYRRELELFKVSGLTSAQAAWLAKWQRGGGKCYLFLGFVNTLDELTHYGILRCGFWDTWLKLPKSLVRTTQLIKHTTDKWEIYEWFMKELRIDKVTRNLSR